MIWENANVTPMTPHVYTVSGPALENVSLRVYAAKITATDYLGLPISGASASVALANGTTIQRTTGSDGVVQLGLIPIGTFQGKLSYLGTTTVVAGDASVQTSTSAKFLLSYPLLAILGVVIILTVSVAAALLRRSHGRRKAEEPAGLRMVVTQDVMHNGEWTQWAALGLNEQFNRFGRILAPSKSR